MNLWNCIPIVGWPRWAIGSLCLVTSLSCGTAAAAEPDVEKLRDDYARHYFDIAPSLRLAHFLKDHDNPIVAFYISENWRLSGGLSEQAFDAEFRKWVFDKETFDNSSENEARLADEVKKQPRDAQLLMKLAQIYISRNDWKNARPLVERAQALQPQNFETVQVLAEIDRRDKGANPQLHYDRFFASNPQAPDTYLQRITRLAEKKPVDETAIQRLAQEAYRRFPQDGRFAFLLAREAANHNQMEEAGRLYEEAANASPDDEQIQGQAGRHFLRISGSQAKALHFYLNAYFLNPHFYDTEFAESRIKLLLQQHLNEAQDERRQGRRDIASLVADKDPNVVYFGIEMAQIDWRPEYVDLLIPLLGHDSDAVRNRSAIVLAEFLDRSYEDKLRALLDSPDLRIRSASAYIAVHLLREESIAALRPFLSDPAELVQYTGTSALLRTGRPGCTVLDEYRKGNIHPRIRALLDSPRVVQNCGWK
jgi:hypothetical protein